jgi:hypothetical protein
VCRHAQQPKERSAEEDEPLHSDVTGSRPLKSLTRRPVRNGQYGPAAMRLVVACCEVVYTGRLAARLPEAVRLLMFKADGSFLCMTTQVVTDL